MNQRLRQAEACRGETRGRIVAAEAMKRDAGECPDLETIAAYLDGRLEGSERTRITAHLATCEECYFVFSEAAQTHLTKKAVEPRPVRLGWRAWLGRPIVLWPSISTALLATVAVLLLVLTDGIGQWRWRESSELQALVVAVGANRTIEPRLTGGFTYGPLRGAMRAGEPLPTAVSVDVRIAAAQIEKRATERRTPQTLKALGVAYLVMGDVNHAVPVLEEAADHTNPDAQVLSDLSAAYLVRARRNNEPQDFAKALTMADRAVKADPHLAEAWFNRADALQHLALQNEARDAWRDYLKVDARSPWAEEARSRLKAIADATQSETGEDERRRVEVVVASQHYDAAAAAEIVDESPQVVRRWIEQQLLVTWPPIALGERFEDARALVSRVEPLADALARDRGDAFARDAVSAVVSASRDPEHLRTLATAHQLYKAAVDAYDADRIADSAKLCARVIEPLERAGSPFAGSARRCRAIGFYYRNDLPDALTEITAVATYARNRGYVQLLGLADRLRGLIHVIGGRFADGLEAYESALRSFELVGDVQNEVAIQASLAEDLQFIGEAQRSWLARYAALSHLGSIREPINRYGILETASLAAVNDELPEVALHLQLAALNDARLAGRAMAVVTGYLNLAEIYSRLGQSNSVLANLLEAQQALRSIQDPLLLSRTEARILLARGETTARDQPTEAIEALSKALAYFEKTGTSWRLADAYLALGRAHLAAHQPSLAEADFASGIRVFEQMRSALTSESLRTSFFEQPWDLYSEMIRLQAERRDGARALIFADQARARTLLDATNGQTNATPTAPTAVQEILPSGVAVLYYAALDDRLLIWVVTRKSEDFVQTAARPTDVARLTERWRSDVGAEARQADTLMALYDMLIRPIENRLPDRAPLVVVPDGVLHAVPFAALLRRENHRYLVEDHVLNLAPSLAMLARSAKHSRTSAPTGVSALVVGNPRGEANTSMRLPEAEDEAREIATLYPNRDLLVDTGATKAQFLALAGHHEIVHFAGHAISNDEYPSLSRLLFAGTGESDRSLLAGDIATTHFDRTKLVVLAACRTSAGRIRRGEGVLSLARPFIAAGVPIVVASLSDVDDRASHAFFVRFHRALRLGAAVADALRSAQLNALADSDAVLRDPTNWATFTVIGGLAALDVPDSVALLAP